MQIRHLFIVLVSVTVVTLAGFFGALWLYRSSSQEVSTAYSSQYHSYLLADGLRQSSDDLTRLVRAYAATGDVQYKDQYNAVLDIRNGVKPRPVEYHRVYWDFVAGGNANPRPLGEAIALSEQMKQAGFTKEEFALLDEAAKRSDGLVKLEVEAMKLVETQDAAAAEAARVEATQLVNSPEYHRFKAEIMTPIDEFYVALESRLQGNIDRALDLANFYWTAMLAAAGLLGLVLAAFGVLVSNRVIRGITGLTFAMTEIADQKLETDIVGRDRTDEIGAMAKALEIFRQAASGKLELEKDAVLQRERAEIERVQMQQDAEEAAQQRLRQATSGLAAGIKRLASGDLDFQLTEAFAPDFEQLRHDLNAAISQLHETLGSVATGSVSIATGTREISQSSDDLSKRTEQQAAALEQTAAALDQITVNVTSSAKRTEEARQIASQANNSAAESGKVVASAVDAMRRIEEASGQIANIIGVIDEIAFQTNLLALNAGVEAARAGDAGKGFAVVAQEVRELAQRSAQAAKEIKELIRNSSVEVDGGVKLVRETGESLKTIEQYIVAINEHMAAISTAAREQSVGLAEVNTAINQMDQVTQKNAAMVEETNAASASLANEGTKLRELIAQFKLADQQATTPANDLRRMGQNMARAAAKPAPVVRQKVAVHGNTALAQEGWDEF